MTVFLTVAGGVLALALIAGGTAVVATAFFHRTRISAKGIVVLPDTETDTPVDPEAYARDMGLTLDEAVGARLVESEAAGLSKSGRIGVLWTARNKAARKGDTLAELVLRPTGLFARQSVNPYAATSRDPSAASIDISRGVFSEKYPDNTGGALHFDSPWSYKDDDDVDEGGRTAEEKAAQFAANRQSEGLELYTLDDVPERKLRFWRPA